MCKLTSGSRVDWRRIAMKKLYWSILCAAIWLVNQGMASATPVIFTDSANTTISGETFTFTETVTIPSLSFGVFTIMAQGDYDDWTDPVFESLDWNIDGIAFGTGWGPANSDLAMTLAPDNVTWFKTIRWPHLLWMTSFPITALRLP